MRLPCARILSKPMLSKGNAQLRFERSKQPRSRISRRERGGNRRHQFLKSPQFTKNRCLRISPEGGYPFG